MGGPRRAGHGVALWMCGFLLSTGLVVAAEGEKPPSRPARFSKMWLGKEFWQFGGGRYAGGADTMPGAILGLRYSGHGDLPAPVEFVLTLDQKLPMGEYIVFVRNFYLGKIEITLGNVTKPAPIKRFDWTPPIHFELATPADQTDKIVLRYFPTMLKDSGVKEEQGYIVQGVFLTTDEYEVPFGDGQIIRLKPKADIPSRKGNYLRGASFESGLGQGWGKSVGSNVLLGAEHLDASTAAHGKFSLKLPLYARKDSFGFPIESRFYLLNPDKKYSLSASLKADRPVKSGMGLVALPATLDRSEPQGGLGRTVEVGTEWSRHSVTGELKKEVPAYLYSVRFTPESKEPATVWIDAVQLEEGDPTPFRPSEDREVGWVCPVPGHIYYETEDAPLTLRFYNPGGLAKAELEYTIEDYYGATVERGTRLIGLSRQVNAEARFDLYKARRGIFRAEFRWGQGQGSEIVYSVLPPNRHLNEVYPEGTLGMDVAGGRNNLRILKRANVSWVMSKFLARWYLVEPERRRYVFDDTLVRDAQAEKLMVMLQFLNPDWGMMPWLRPLMKPHRLGAWPDAQKQSFLRAWEDMVANVVTHYRPWVRHFEVWNEPNAEWTAGDYGLLLRTAYAAAKRANPDAVVIGFSGGGFEPKYCEEAIAVAGPDSFDAISVHLYHNNPGVHAAFAEFLSRHHRPGWNTETGLSCPSFYANLPTFESLTQDGHRGRTLESIRACTRNNVNNYLMSLSVGGMERYMYYFCRFVNSSPSQPSLRQGSMKDCVEFDGALRANGVAMSIASHFLDGASYAGPWRTNAVEAHLYRHGAQTVGFLWLKDDATLTPPLAGLTLYDIMGNPLPPSTPHRPAGDPIYFTLTGAPDQAMAALATLHVN